MPPPTDDAALAGLLARLDVGGIEARCEALAEIGRMGAAAGSAVPRLIDLLAHDGAVDASFTGFGPTPYDPGRDFPFAIAAAEALIAIGAPAIEPVLAILRDTRGDARRYQAAVIVGRLRVIGAIALLEEAITRREVVGVRVNFDQAHQYPVHAAALVALTEIDPARAASVVAAMQPPPRRRRTSPSRRRGGADRS